MLTLDRIARSVGGRTLFEDLTWTLHPGERYGFVGANGSGKTSLLRVMAGRDEPDGGRLRPRRGLRVAYLPQEVEAELPADAPIIEAVLTASDEIRAIGREAEELAVRMAALSEAGGDPEELARVSEAYGERRTLFEWFGGDELEARARVVLGGLGFSNDDVERPVRTFSGGWRMRALMARLLMSGADLLLLDEPTNHLDLDALAWLEDHLRRSPSALVVVSHDRFFLDRVVERIADLHRHGLRVTPGNYSDWVRRRDAERELAGKKAKKLDSEAARLERFVERFRYKATKARQAQDRARLLEDVRIERGELRIEAQADQRFRWPDPPATPDPIVELEGVGKSYGEKRVLDAVNLVVRAGERLALLGPNGAGKTTLMRIIAGDLTASEGRRGLGVGLLVGYYAQHQLEAMDAERNVLDEIADEHPAKLPEELRAALGLFGLGADHVERPVRTLSGGEKSRLALAKLYLRPCNLLLLDEPTNHLDLPLRRALEEALKNWPGTLIVVSHDRAFLDALTSDALAVEAGRAERVSGGWQGWLAARDSKNARAEQRNVEGAPVHELPREGRRARAQALQERNRRLRPLRERVRSLEAEIEAAEARRDAVDEALADPATHTRADAMRDLSREREDLEDRLARLFDAWDEATQELEREEQA